MPQLASATPAAARADLPQSKEQGFVRAIGAAGRDWNAAAAFVPSAAPNVGAELPRSPNSFDPRLDASVGSTSRAAGAGADRPQSKERGFVHLMSANRLPAGAAGEDWKAEPEWAKIMNGWEQADVWVNVLGLGGGLLALDLAPGLPAAGAAGIVGAICWDLFRAAQHIIKHIIR